MGKPTPERLHLSTYRWVYDTAPRFGDVDPLQHLNNAAITRIYEDARVRFIDMCGLRQAWTPGCRMVVAELTVQYLAEGFFPDALSVGAGVMRIGRSSFTNAQGLFQNGRCIGTSDTILVHVDTASGAARPWSDAARGVLAAHALHTGLSPALSQEQTETEHA